MKHLVLPAVLISLLISGAASIADAQVKKSITVHGDLVDLITFVSSGAKQETDAITKSAKAGNPLALYDTKAKKLYLVGTLGVNKNVNETLIPYIGMRTFITGKVYSKNGVNLILMSDVGKSIK